MRQSYFLPLKHKNYRTMIAHLYILKQFKFYLKLIFLVSNIGKWFTLVWTEIIYCDKKYIIYNQNIERTLYF